MLINRIRVWKGNFLKVIRHNVQNICIQNPLSLGLVCSCYIQFLLHFTCRNLLTSRPYSSSSYYICALGWLLFRRESFDTLILIDTSEILPSWVYERTLRIQYADVTHSQQQNVAKGCVFLWKFYYKWWGF